MSVLRKNCIQKCYLPPRRIALSPSLNVLDLRILKIRDWIFLSIAEIIFKHFYKEVSEGTKSYRA